MPDNELQLVLEAVGGNADSFGQLADRYSPTLLGLAYTLTGDMELARDIAQEALIKAYTALSTLQRPERFGSWLRQIAANLARTHLRSQGRHPQVPLVESEGREGHPLEETVERRLARQELLQTLQAVPEGPRAAMVLHYLVGLSPAEAARQLGISRVAFDTRLSRGREALRRELTLLMDETKQQVEIYLAGISERVKATLKLEQRERVTAAKELALLAGRANLPRLFRDLKGPDEGVRKLAAQLLGETLDPRAVAPLTEALPTEENAAVQAEICRSLARLGATSAIPVLHTLSRNTADMAVHKAADDAAKALQSAAGTGTPGDIAVEIDDLKKAGIEPLFLALLQDEAPAVRVQAADGLGRVESVKSLAPLCDMLKGDSQPYVRRAAAVALGAVLWPGRTTKDRIPPAQRTKAVQALTAALADADMAVQAEAAWSLSLISPTDLTGEIMPQLHAVLEAAATGRPGPWWVTFPALAGALGAPTDRAKIASLLLRSDIRWKGPITEAVLLMSRPGETEGNATVLEALQTNVDPKCRWKVVKALGLTVDPTVTGAFQKFLSDREPKVREEAARAIAGYPEGQDLLKTAMTESADEGLITAAAPFVDDPAFLEELSVRLTPKSRITVQAAAAKQKARR